MYSKIPEEETEASPELQDPREICVGTSGNAESAPSGWSSRLHGRWIVALSLVVGVVVAAVVMTLVSQASFSIVNSAKMLVEAEAEEDPDQIIEKDVKRDPILENYLASPEMGIPSLEPEMIKTLAPLWPSLFCWCIMQTVGLNHLGWLEERLIKQQIERSIGIFSCNEWAVMTDEALALNRWGPKGFPKIPKGITATRDTRSWAIGSTQVAKGAMTNPLNAMPFRTAWQALQRSKRLAKHDWVIKVDPDTVWFPVRLRVHLKMKMPGHGNGWDNLFLTNCQRYNSMQGPLEVISRQAATKLENSIQNCGGIWGTGEDQFLQNCLKQLGVPPMMEPGLLNDKYCDGYIDCTNSWRVAFHPHKYPPKFLECFNQSASAELLAK